MFVWVSAAAVVDCPVQLPGTRNESTSSLAMGVQQRVDIVCQRYDIETVTFLLCSCDEESSQECQELLQCCKFGSLAVWLGAAVVRAAQDDVARGALPLDLVQYGHEVPPLVQA